MDFAQLEIEASERLDRGVFDFLAGGAGEERTLAANLAAWSRLRLRPRVLRDVRVLRTGVSVLGTPLAAPLMVAPTGFQRLAHPDGETATARGAAEAGSLLVISTRASVRVEAIAAAVPDAPRWFQVYVLRDRGLTAELVRRAVAAGCGAMVLTADTPYVGRKRREQSNAFCLPLGEGMANLYPPDTVLEPTGLGSRAEQDPGVTFEDIGWLAQLSGVPAVVKGVLRGDDARACVDAGAAAVVVSNHGGRQLDGAQATADALAEVVEAVGGRGEVYVDGGIRHGSDILKALPLGARAVMIGRPVLWGLAANGSEGVRRVLDELAKEFAEALALCGAKCIAELSPDLIAGGA